MNTVNFGIDLGTTNSMIASYIDGTLEVYKNPLGLKSTLASAVAYRKNKIFVGDKARDLYERDPLNVFTCFKRKMGTSDRYWVPNIEKELGPIELSSEVLKELQNFVHTGTTINEVVITIPSSFDTIQSNATKLAGQQAGFQQVYLLQEPIAASLAFANKNNLDIEEEKYWLVYDFGGGTFDVALLKIDNREIDVVDNSGDNYLGGLDIDNLIVERLIIPVIQKEFAIENLWEECRKKDSKYKRLYYELLFKAEEAKKELSVFETVEIEVEIEEEDFYETIEISRIQFNDLINPLIQRTIEFILDLLTRNNIKPEQVERMLMVGGTTLIPYVKKKLLEEVKIPLSSEVDPTEAVGKGAAYFAGSKFKKINEDISQGKPSDYEDVDFTILYERNSRDDEELIHIKADVEFRGTYRIIRKDGGFDSGMVQFTKEAYIYVDLLENELNTFQLDIYDEKNKVIYTNQTLAINHGKYQVKGQVLPIDICLEIDDMEYKETRLELVFKKNSILPLRKMIYKTISKTILKGSEDSLRINIVEGNNAGLPSSGLTIGYIEIPGNLLESDLIKGTDIELEIKLSESRDLEVDVFLNSIEQDFINKFTPSERYLSKDKLERELDKGVRKLERELETNGDDYDFLAKLKKIKDQLIELQIALNLSPEEDISDTKYSIDNQKRELMNEYDLLTRNRVLNEDITEYRLVKSYLEAKLNEEGNQQFMSRYEHIIKDEVAILNSGNKYLIKAKIKELNSLDNTMFNSDEKNFIDVYLHFKMNADVFIDKIKAERMFLHGDKALEDKDYRVLKSIVYQLNSLLPKDNDTSKDLGIDDQTGIQ
ncbi:Hsp70 family protein [Tenacibaculum xiamenense]|uniref:Hsp70 family protein n=1 Tax=Tenacibaculum xiamenense TaxID=1261553 RepID=UPI0038932537